MSIIGDNSIVSPLWIHHIMKMLVPQTIVLPNTFFTTFSLYIYDRFLLIIVSLLSNYLKFSFIFFFKK